MGTDRLARVPCAGWFTGLSNRLTQKKASLGVEYLLQGLRDLSGPLGTAGVGICHRGYQFSEVVMFNKTYVTVVSFGMVALLAAACGETGGVGGSVDIDEDDLGGVVTGPNGQPEAGVWVIAETTDLPTRLAKIVVTDDEGRYLLPDLPAATYDVWVRGYGLIDSPKVQSTPGQQLNLTAVMAPDERAAAAYYPAGYWFSLIRVPDKSEFPGTGESGNGIARNMRHQAQWVRRLKSGGGAGRAISLAARGLGRFPRPWVTSSRRSMPGSDAFSQARPGGR